MNCYKCGQPGHFAASCPLNTPASGRDEHLARIDALVTQWAEGEISTEDKRRLISAENTLFYGADSPALRARGLTYP